MSSPHPNPDKINPNLEEGGARSLEPATPACRGTGSESAGEWYERDEQEKMEYIITIERAVDNSIVGLLMQKIYRPLGFSYGNRKEWNYYVVFDGDLALEAYESAYNYDGTYTKFLYKIIVETDFEETPWFLSRNQLAESIKSDGVKQSIQDTLEYIADLVDSLVRKVE